MSGNLQFYVFRCINFHCLFSIGLEVGEEFRFFALECPEMRCNGCMARTAVSATVCMNTDRLVRNCR